MIHEFKGEYKNDTYFCGWNCGFFSNCSVTLWKIIDYYNENIEVKQIDFSKGFVFYKNEDKSIDNYPLYFDLNSDLNIYISEKIEKVDHHGEYLNIRFDHYTPFIEKYFSINQEIIDIQNNFISKYEIDFAKTIVAYYRGTDKVTEIDLIAPVNYIDKILKLIHQNPDFRILVQTDDQKFLDLMLKFFRDRCFYFDELPHSSGKFPEHMSNNSLDRIQNGKLFLASTHLISKCNTILLGPSNVSLWTCLFRGNTNEVYQFNTKIK